MKRLSRKGYRITIAIGLITVGSIATIPILTGCTKLKIGANNAQKLATTFGATPISFNGLNEAADVSFLCPGTTNLTNSQKATLQALFQTLLKTIPKSNLNGWPASAYTLNLTDGTMDIGTNELTTTIIFKNPGQSTSQTLVQSTSTITLAGFNIPQKAEATTLAQTLGTNPISMAGFTEAKKITISSHDLRLSSNTWQQLNALFVTYLKANLPFYVGAFLPANCFTLSEMGAHFGNGSLTTTIQFNPPKTVDQATSQCSADVSSDTITLNQFGV